MLYFDLAIYKEDLLTENERKKPKFVQDVIYNYRRFFGQLLKQDIYGKQLIILSKVSKRVLKKVNKVLKINVEKNICISEELKLRKEFIEFVNSKELNVLDGRWLFKYMIEDVLVFICNCLNFQIETQEISILTNENNNFIFESIIKISKTVKNINIITKNPKIFKTLTNKIYEECGLIVKVTSDLKKTALKSNIILNFNFDEKEIKKVNFDKKAIIVNFEKDISINRKNFTGKIVNFYHVNLPSKYLKIYKKFKNFNSTILYESFVYKNTLNKNIWNEIKNDNVKIDCLEDRNKIIKFSKVNKMMNNLNKLQA